MKQRIYFTKNDCLHVFRLGKTSNKKISNDKDKIVQSYTFSLDQFKYINTSLRHSLKIDFKHFFSLDKSNCLDCPFSVNTSGKVGLCYTHKFMQFSGFVSMLKSICKEIDGNIENLSPYNNNHKSDLLKMSFNRFVRFGSYGEPSLHPIDLVESIAMVAKNWTGYTHQFRKRKEFAPFFMASVHNDQQAQTAKDLYNYRSFISYKGELISEAVQCPASKEAGFKSVCSLCSLCSGNNGKGVKDVKINIH